MSIWKFIVGILLLASISLVVFTIYNLVGQIGANENSTELLNPFFKSFNIDYSGRWVFLGVAIVATLFFGCAFKRT